MYASAIPTALAFWVVWQSWGVRGFPARAVPGTVDPAIVNNLVILHIPLPWR